MTGFFIIRRGFNFENESPIAGLMMLAWNSEREFSLDFAMVDSMSVSSGAELEVLDDRTEGQHREEGESADEENGASEQCDEQPTTDWEARRSWGDALLLRHIAGNREYCDDRQEAPEHHVDCECQRIKYRMIVRIRSEPSKRATVVACPGAESVENFREAVRVGLPGRAWNFRGCGVEDARAPCVGHQTK